MGDPRGVFPASESPVLSPDYSLFDAIKGTEGPDWNKVGRLVLLKPEGEIRKAFMTQLDKDGFSALYRAVEAGNLSMVQFLIELATEAPFRSFLMTQENKNNDTALHCAVRENNMEMVKLLVNKASNDKSRNFLISREDRSGWTALHLAAANNNFAMVEFLIDNYKAAGTDAWTMPCRLDFIVQKNNSRMSALSYAALNNNLVMVKFLVSCVLSKIDATTEIGQDDLEMFITGAKDWRYSEIYPERSALYSAVQKDNLEMVKFLVGNFSLSKEDRIIEEIIDAKRRGVLYISHKVMKYFDDVSRSHRYSRYPF